MYDEVVYLWGHSVTLRDIKLKDTPIHIMIKLIILQ